MIKVGITGQNGFIGQHLSNFLGLQEDISLIPFEREYFENEEKMIAFVKECDTIIHLAALNRHQDQEVIYDTNLTLVDKLIAACKNANHSPHILFSSSTQEEANNLYGQSKANGRKKLEEWSKGANATVSGLIIPNVFGPFGKPHYNSVVATFCHLIARNEEVQIVNDSNVKLIYVNELLEEILDIIRKPVNGRIEISSRHEITVNKLKERLLSFMSKYVGKGEMPNLSDAFSLALFNTFRCYLPDDVYPIKLTEHKDDRGAFVEIIRTNSQGQFSFSTTVPGITRGNHFHTRKAERFAVIKGKASIQIRKIGQKEVVEYILDGQNPAFVDMPIWHTHNIKNIGNEELLTLFWINEAYDQSDPDTYFINV